MVTVRDVRPSGETKVFVEPVALERRQWMPRVPELYSRAEVLRQTGPYASTRTASIGRCQLTIPSSIAADIDEATRALTDFDTYAQRTLGSGDAALGPMSAILLRTESASSSQIEHLTTSAKQIALAEIDEGDKRNALHVVSNVRAMEAALRLSESVTSASILAMHRELLKESVLHGEFAGRWREELVWIDGDDAGPIGASFIAQQHTHVPGSIEDVVEFARRRDVQPLVQVAVAHAQFETIHPFVDGNGRTGRALAQAMLRNLGVVTHTTVPISAGLLINTGTYFDALGEYRDGDAAPIIHRFADASRYAVVSGRELVSGLADELAISRGLLSGVRSHSRAHSILPLLVGQPIVNTSYITRTLGISVKTALRALDTLTDRGILVERSGWKRNRVWEHRGILTVLDEYAATIRRLARSA